MKLIKIKPRKFNYFSKEGRESDCNFVTNFVKENYPEYFYNENAEWGFSGYYEHKDKDRGEYREVYDLIVITQIVIGLIDYENDTCEIDWETDFPGDTGFIFNNRDKEWYVVKKQNGEVAESG